MLRDQHPLRSQFRKLHQRLKRDSSGEESYLRLLERAEASVKVRAERESLSPCIAVPEELPIALHAEELQHVDDRELEGADGAECISALIQSYTNQPPIQCDGSEVKKIINFDISI